MVLKTLVDVEFGKKKCLFPVQLGLTDCMSLYVDIYAGGRGKTMRPQVSYTTLLFVGRSVIDIENGKPYFRYRGGQSIMTNDNPK